MAAPNQLSNIPFISSDPANNPGGIYLDNGAVSSNGLGGVNFASIGLAQSAAAAVAITTGSAIAIPANTSVVRLAPAAAVTGIIMPLGTRTGQILIIINTTAAANTITFAAVGTSFVAGGAAVSLAGLAAHQFVWDNTASLWYQVGPLAN